MEERLFCQLLTSSLKLKEFGSNSGLSTNRENNPDHLNYQTGKKKQFSKIIHASILKTMTRNASRTEIFEKFIYELVGRNPENNNAFKKSG